MSVLHPPGSLAERQSLRARLEAQRIRRIELQTILDATERRLATVESTLAERERQLARDDSAWEAEPARAEVVRIRQENEHLKRDLLAARAESVATAQRNTDLHAAVTTLQAVVIELRAGRDDMQRQCEGARQLHIAEMQRAGATILEQTELLRDAAGGREELSQQLVTLRAAHASLDAELGSQRDENARLAVRLHELETLQAPAPLPAAPEPEPVPAVATGTHDDARSTPAAAAEPLTIVHIEDQPADRDAVRAAAGRLPGVRYLCPQFPPAGTVRSATLLAVNLLCRHLDPLAVIADATRWGVSEPRAFTYCSDGARAMVLGLIEYFPFPFDPGACAGRLLERPEGGRRILAVSNHIELMTRLRAILSTRRCSTTVALDARQALDLVKPVNPELILIDLALPRGDGLDLVSRLFSDSTTAAIPVAFVWTQKLGSGIFRQYAARVLQDWHGAGTGIVPSLVRLLSPPPSGGERPLRLVG